MKMAFCISCSLLFETDDPTSSLSATRCPQCQRWNTLVGEPESLARLCELIAATEPSDKTFDRAMRRCADMLRGDAKP